MLRPILESLQSLGRVAMCRADWEEQLGASCFEQLPRDYFVNTRKLAAAVPCRRKPSLRRHHVLDELPTGRLIASSADDDICCSSFRVERDQAIAWKLDVPHIIEDLAETLSLDPPAELLSAGLWRLGTLTNQRIPVLFSFAALRSGHADNAIRVSAQRHDRFIFLVPSEQDHSQAIRDAIAAAGGRFASVCDFLRFDRDNVLFAFKELSDQWPDLGKPTPGRLAPVGFAPGTDWRHIVVTLMRNGRLSIAHHTGNPHRFYTAAQLELLRENGTPRKAWSTLQQCVDLGCIPFGYDTKTQTDARNRMRDLTKSLRLATGFDTPAFEKDERAVKLTRRHTRAAPGYWPVFKLRREEERFAGPRNGNYQLDSAPEADPAEEA